MGKLFGTDGIRGTSNQYPMTADIAQKVGMAAGSLIKKHDSLRRKVVIGKDTRLSGYMFEPALTSGFISVGVDVTLVGPMPTPAVAMLTKSMRADIGVMLSASHNPFHDNGIKMFDAQGIKISSEIEQQIEAMVLGDDPSVFSTATPELLGRAQRLKDAPGRYIELVKNTFPKGVTLNGLKIVIDCANGAAYHLGKTILWELGAEVIDIGTKPNGFNINDQCGSTHPEAMCRMVKENNAHIGLALDGDADRLIVSDEQGTIIDGDQLMALIAGYWHQTGKLTKPGMVATVMSNMGLEQHLHNLGLSLERIPVGDRFVSECMREKGYNLGGEQSGHIILSNYSTTGDGLIAALQILAVLVEQKKAASELLNVFTPYPQMLKNIRFDKTDPLEVQNVQDTIKEAETMLGNEGRVLVRKSGTEPLLRVMVEAQDKDICERATTLICNSVEKAIQG